MSLENRENPYIRNLGACLSNEDFTKKVAVFPEGFARTLPNDFDEREHLMEKLLTDWFLPEERHYLLYRELHKVLRHGYEGRPDNKFLEIIDNTADWLKNHKNKTWVPKEIFKKPIRTISLFGTPGMGKSHFWNVVLPRCFTQVTKVSNKLQVTYLVLNCSSFKSLKSVCTYFFVAMDDALRSYYNSIGMPYTNSYHNDYDKPYFTAEKLMPHMANVAAQHHLGVLIIDEINHLTDGNKEFIAIVNFFKNLTNAIGLPVVLSGTQDALDKLLQNLQMIRRIVGGLTEWDFYEKDTAKWNKFIAELWSFQVTESIEVLSLDIVNMFYESTAGVMDFCVQLHVKAQTKALLYKKKVDAKFLEKIWKSDFKRAQEVVDAIKKKNYSKFKDIVQGMPTLTEKLLNNDPFKRITSDLTYGQLTKEQAGNLIALLKSQHPELSHEKAMTVVMKAQAEAAQETDKVIDPTSSDPNVQSETSKVLDSAISDDPTVIKSKLEKDGLSGPLSNVASL